MQMTQFKPFLHIRIFYCVIILKTLAVMPVGLGIILQYFYGTDRTASILSSNEKCQVLKFGIEWPKELISSASVSKYPGSMLVVPKSNNTVDWLCTCVLQEKHQITPRDRADREYVQCSHLSKQIGKKIVIERSMLQELVLKSTYWYWYRYWIFLNDIQPYDALFIVYVSFPAQGKFSNVCYFQIAILF